MTKQLPASPDNNKTPGTPAENKAKGGRPKGAVADSALSALLEHIKAWGESAAPTTGTNWIRVNAAELERHAEIRKGFLSSWYNCTTKKGTPVRLNRAEYERLVPLLKAWYGYEPPATLPTT